MLRRRKGIRLGININIFLNDKEVEEKLDLVLEMLTVIFEEGEQEMADLSALTAAVAADGDAVNSAVTLLGSLAQQIRDLSTDPAALQALADDLDAHTQDLAAAVAANTPAAPPPA